MNRQRKTRWEIKDWRIKKENKTIFKAYITFHMFGNSLYFMKASWKVSEGISPTYYYKYTNVFLNEDPLGVHRIKSPAVFISAGGVEELKLGLS